MYSEIDSDSSPINVLPELDALNRVRVISVTFPPRLWTDYNVLKFFFDKSFLEQFSATLTFFVKPQTISSFTGFNEQIITFLKQPINTATVVLNPITNSLKHFLNKQIIRDDVLVQNYFNHNEYLYSLWKEPENSNANWFLNKSGLSLIDSNSFVYNNLITKYFFSQEVNRLQKTGVNKETLVFNLNQFINTDKDSVYLKDGSHSHTHVYWVMKQKRTNIKRQINYDMHTLSDYQLNNVSSWYTTFGGDHKSFIFQIQQKRLLRTNRILLLPININITLITNSFDVIHSWYIPGLGIKLDCVPGRSTHHNLNIQNIGFYYGQCAEICGRYHHHMPIRICAVSFHQFIVWWSHFGIRKFIKPNNVVSNKFIF